MATRRIVEIGDETLRKHAKKVEKFDLRLRILLKDMADTMYTVSYTHLDVYQRQHPVPGTAGTGPDCF